MFCGYYTCSVSKFMGIPADELLWFALTNKRSGRCRLSQRFCLCTLAEPSRIIFDSTPNASSWLYSPTLFFSFGAWGTSTRNSKSKNTNGCSRCARTLQKAKETEKKFLMRTREIVVLKISNSRKIIGRKTLTKGDSNHGLLVKRFEIRYTFYFSYLGDSRFFFYR